MFFLCSHAYRKGAVCWWRRSCLCADGIRLSAIRLVGRHPAPARRLGLALSMESERVGGNLTRDVLAQHLRDFRDLHPRMIARRVDKAIEASLHSTAPKQHVLNQCRKARIHAALHEPEAPQFFGGLAAADLSMDAASVASESGHSTRYKISGSIMSAHRSGAESDLIESGRPLSFLVLSRIFFNQPVSTGSENALMPVAPLIVTQSLSSLSFGCFPS